MRPVIWKPIDDFGNVDHATLAAPGKTEKPTLCELHFNGDKAQLAALFSVAVAVHERHTFRIVAPDVSRLEPTEAFKNIRVAIGPLHHQFEVDAAVPALLRFPAAYREIILCPTVPCLGRIDLYRVASTGRDTDRNHIRYTDALNGYTYDGLYSVESPDAYERHARLDGVLIRGGEDPIDVESVRLVLSQVSRSIGHAKFSLDWGNFFPMEAAGSNVSLSLIRGHLDRYYLGEDRDS